MSGFMRFFLLGFLILGFTGMGEIKVSAYEKGVWQRTVLGVNETEIFVVKPDPQEANHLLISSSRRLYQSWDGGVSFLPFGDLAGVNSIVFSKHHPGRVYAASDQGLFYRDSSSLDWQRILWISKSNGFRCLSVAEGERGLYVGTNEGVYFKDKKDNTWSLLQGIPSEVAVTNIQVHESNVFFLTQFSLIKMNERNFVLQTLLDISKTEISVVSEDDVLYFNLVPTALAVDSGLLAVVLRGQLKISTNLGEAWLSVAGEAMAPDNIRALVWDINSEHHEQYLWVASSHGVYVFDRGAWTKASIGMEAESINDIAFSKDGVLFAATQQGLFRQNNLDADSFLTHKNDGEYLKEEAMNVNFSKPILCADSEMDSLISEDKPNFSHEPSIQQVHRWAIEYAEVSNNKIASWRRQAKMAALFPKLSLGTDLDQSLSYSDSIYGTSSSGGAHYMAPDNKDYRHSTGWDVSLSWDFSEWIWSSAQTSIDSRSKMMVELRESILSQVTRLYFERRRLQIRSSSPETLYSENLGEKFDLEMRILELTALLDGFTGERFSAALGDSKRETVY